VLAKPWHLSLSTYCGVGKTIALVIMYWGWECSQATMRGFQPFLFGLKCDLLSGDSRRFRSAIVFLESWSGGELDIASCRYGQLEIAILHGDLEQIANLSRGAQEFK
jgi:hypothetical protein